MKIGKYDWSNVEWSKGELQKFRDIQYIALWIVYVIGDWVTTYQLLNFTHIKESNILMIYIFTLPFGYLMFFFIKHISFEIIISVIRYQNRLYKHTGYVTYTIVLIISLYIVINNIFVIYF